jgi:citrate synthase
MNFTDKYGE